MLGERLRQLRKEQNLTQKDFGEKFNLSSRVIGYYESEERTPTPDFLLKIAEYFNVSTDYLLGKTDNRNIETKKEINATTIAAHRLGDIEDLPDEAIDQLNDYIEYLKLKYKK
ncbi:MAG: helix-turn-helix domain-containing protein [Romboutsia timonensis]|jgi:transcriptional regulator with XRE-family HTH domain|uniref:helix-turn-helix domain-containing protein n=1 Tax=Romboutsia timonensis TaxID=1776391 RepID=UPI003995B9D7